MVLQPFHLRIELPAQRVARRSSERATRPARRADSTSPRNSRILDRLLREIPGITPQKLDERCTRNGQYAYIFHFNKKQFAKISTERFIAAMNAEGIPNQASYPPLHELHMFRNGEYRKRLSGKQAKQKHTFLKKKFPATQKAAWETVWIPQPALLGDEEDMHEIAAALAKIQKNAKELG